MSSLKKLSDGYLKSYGVDAHDVKREYGCNPVSHYDIYNGSTITIRDKQGSLFADTGLTKDEFFETFGNVKGSGYGKE